MDSGWMEIAILRQQQERECPPAAPDEAQPEPPQEDDAVDQMPVIVWHVYSGAMVARRDLATKNRFITHWLEIDDTAWIDAGTRRPTREDADEYDCVIARNKWGDVRTAGWHRFGRESALCQWQPTPTPPPDFRELRNAIR